MECLHNSTMGLASPEVGHMAVLSLLCQW